MLKHRPLTEACTTFGTPCPRGRRIIDDACGDSPPLPGNWDVRLGAASASCGQRTYTNIVKNRAQRLKIEARRPRSEAALGVLRKPLGDTPAALVEDSP